MPSDPWVPRRRLRSAAHSPPPPPGRDYAAQLCPFSRDGDLICNLEVVISPERAPDMGKSGPGAGGGRKGVGLCAKGTHPPAWRG